MRYHVHRQVLYYVIVEKAKYSSFQQYASWNEIDHLISDTDFPQEFADKLQEFTNVILV